MTISQNFDQDEIDKFNDMAARWWDPHGAFKALHDVNPARLSYISERSNNSASRILDVGCGGGILTESLCTQGKNISGIDAAPKPLKVAQLHAMEQGLKIDYTLSTAESLSEKKAAQFDIVTCMEMLEHVPKPNSVVKACARLVKPGGRVFFSTINRNPKSYLFAILGAEYVLKLLPTGTHTFRKFQTKVLEVRR